MTEKREAQDSSPVSIEELKENPSHVVKLASEGAVRILASDGTQVAVLGGVTEAQRERSREILRQQDECESVR